MKTSIRLSLSVIAMSSLLSMTSAAQVSKNQPAPEFAHSNLKIKPTLENQNSGAKTKPWSFTAEIGHNYQLIDPKPVEKKKDDKLTPTPSDSTPVPSTVDSTPVPATQDSSAAPKEYETPARFQNTYLALKGSYMFQNSLKLGVESGYVQDEVESQKSSIYDVLVYLRRKFVPSFGTADYSLQLSNIIPTSKDAAENTSHEFGIGVSGKVFSKPGTILWGWVDVDATIGFSRNYFEYTKSTQDKDNYQTTANQRFKSTLKMSKFNFSVEFLHRFLWNYKDQQTTRYGHCETLQYNVNSTYSLSLYHDVGIDRGIGVTKSDGTSNIGVTNDDASTLGLTFSISI